MCVGMPMQVISVHPGWVWAQAGADAPPERIDTALVGDVAPGSWLMTFLGAAREVIDAQTAQRSLAAVEALAALMRGEAVDLDAAFADLVAREPTLPAFLQEGSQ